MEWFILSRDMHVLCVPSTDSPNSLPIFDDKQTILISNNTVLSTYDFSVQQRHADANNLQMGNYVVFKDKYKKTRMYTLVSYDGDDLTRTWHAEDVGLDLINETANKWDYTGQPHTIEWYLLNNVIDDSGWTIGINEIPTLTRALKFDGQSDSKLRRMGDVANQFGGAEIDFTIEMNGSAITKQVVNIYKKVGTDLTEQRFIDTINLKSLQSSGSIANLCTAMLGLGSNLETEDGSDGGQITFTNESYDDGRYYSPVGQPYIFDREARQQWSRFRGYGFENQGEFDGYIDGIYNYETKDPKELLNRTLTELKKRNTPSETFEANLLDIKADVGDMVQIAHNNYNPPVYLSARVEQVENCYTANGQDTGILGDYQRLQSQIDPRIQDMIDALKNQIKANYTWIRYAKDDKGTGMTATPTTDTKYIAIVSNMPTAVPSDDPQDYKGKWQLIQGLDGKDGIPGQKGADGKTSYTHFAYANNVSGTADFSLDDPTGRSYMGVYSDFTKADSNNPSEYVWSYTKGETGPDGAQGIPGKPGADGKTSYTHVAYADNNEGGGFSQLPANKAYMGWYTDFTANDSTDTTKYAWSLIKGSDGLDGAQGIPGPKGADGKTPYTHIAYADTATGGGLSQLPDGKKYIGMYVDFTENDSGDPQKYAWSLIKGADGKDGTPGKDGVAGKDGVGVKTTTIAYAQSTSGATPPTTGWTAGVPTLIKGQYLWTRTVWTYTDNTTETGYTVSYNAKDGNSGSDGRAGKDGVGISSTVIEYAVSSNGVTKPTTGWSALIPSVTPGQFLWTRTTWSYTDSTNEVGYSVAQAGTTGPAGKDGANGVAGKPGADGRTPYFHTAWADSADGKINFSLTDATNRGYLGTYTDFTQADSTDTTKYAWSLIKGRDGSNGAPGKPGVDGKTPYFHQAWADSKDGKVNFSTTDPTNRGYLGTYSDFTQADSNDPSKYFWVELVGAFEVGGINLIVRHNELKDRMIGSSGEVAPYAGSSLTKVVVSVKPGNALTMTRYNSAADNNFRFAFYDASGAVVKRDYNADLSHTEEVPPKSTTFRISYSTNLTVKLERGRKSSEYTLAPEDAQKQIDSINQGLADTNKLIAETPVPYVGPTAPTNPKKGDQWWVKDASNHVTAFKQWDGSKWVDSMIQQSLLNIVTLNAVTINGSTINGSKFTNNFDFTNKEGIHFQGVTTIANGKVDITWKLPANNQTGHTYMDAAGFESVINDAKGSPINSIFLRMGRLDMITGKVVGTLNAQDAYRASTQSIQYLSGWGDWGNGAGLITVSRNGRLVTLSGYPKHNGTPNFTNIAQLPEWAKPAHDVNLPAMSLNSGVVNPMAAKLVVNTNGVLSATFTQQSGYVAIGASYFGKDL
ncbi:phage tail spike protein [Latilactobacillus curvatus]